jgi:hypothetical protein
VLQVLAAAFPTVLEIVTIRAEFSKAHGIITLYPVLE